MKRLNVLFVITSLGVGGIEIYLLRFLRWAGSRINATVVCKKSLGELEGDYRAAGAEIEQIMLPAWPSAGHIEFARLVNRKKPDVVCDFTGSFGAWVLLVSMICGVSRRIAFYRGAGHGFLKVTWLKLRYTSFLSFLTRVTCTDILSNSARALHNFHPRWKASPKIFAVVRNPAVHFVDTKPSALTREDLGLQPSDLVVLHVGRATPEKNHSLIVELAARLKNKRPDIKFLLVGPNVQQLISALNGNFANVVTLGYRRDISEMMQCADMFIFPSVSEGMPNALIEAMAAGLPVVTSDVDEIIEVLPCGYEWIFKSGDVAAFERGIIRLERASYKEVGASLREYALQTYAVDVLFGQFLRRLQGAHD